jgi:hypothetical protein
MHEFSDFSEGECRHPGLRVNTLKKQDLRLENVADASEQRLVEERLCDGSLALGG